ncbi:hypothetical protein AH4AK4_1532 [Aeromonas hydrophila 4AK4]|jgi:hypothetical protein|nr:hypothetical protein AH4AK4_1532 [Aeromonas hydrophila 4AK4]
MATFSENIIQVVKKQYRTEVFSGLSVFLLALAVFFSTLSA